MEDVVLAYSGGLDTSFCLVHLRKHGYRVATLTVDTGGFSARELSEIEERARTLGSIQHRTIDACSELYERFAAYVIKGNILRGHVYPLCVGAERTLQAEKLMSFARELGFRTVAHGCTGAGNDQVRFDIAIRCGARDGVHILAPIRELRLSRDQELRTLREAGIQFPEKKGTYSLNLGMLGVTIGGGETHDSWAPIPHEAYVLTSSIEASPDKPEFIELEFAEGLPIALSNQKMHGVEILKSLNQIAGAHGIGRGIHLGDTVLGIKGRIAFEAPGALTLITAHRELEKLVLTKWQHFIKDQATQLYAMLLHEGQWPNPALRDIEALIDSTQRRVSGRVRVKLFKGHATIEGAQSPHSLMDARASYGEGSTLWDGRDAEGFCKIFGTQTILAARRDVL